MCSASSLQRDRLIRHANYRWRNPMSPDLQRQIYDLAFNDTGLPSCSDRQIASSIHGRFAPFAEACSRSTSRKQISVKRRPRPWPSARIAASRRPRKSGCPQSRRCQVRCGGCLARCCLPCVCWISTAGRGRRGKRTYGYYFHSAMIRLSWSELDVLEKSHTLDNNGRKKAKKAGSSESVQACMLAVRVCCVHAKRHLTSSWPATTPVIVLCVLRHRRFLRGPYC